MLYFDKINLIFIGKHLCLTFELLLLLNEISPSSQRSPTNPIFLSSYLTLTCKQISFSFIRFMIRLTVLTECCCLQSRTIVTTSPSCLFIVLCLKKLDLGVKHVNMLAGQDQWLKRMITCYFFVVHCSSLYLEKSSCIFSPF